MFYVHTIRAILDEEPPAAVLVKAAGAPYFYGCVPGAHMDRI